MLKIYAYECRRLMWNKFFPGIALVLLFYGWQILDRITILGVAHTAPFSAWSYGDYLGYMLPLLWIGTLFTLSFFTSGAEERRRRLTSATPVKPSHYALARCCAAMTATAVLSLEAVALAVVFYVHMFGGCGFGELVYPTLITLIPTLVFALGSGWILAGIRPWLLFVWMLPPVALAAIPLPEALGLLNGSLFETRALALGVLDPAFSLSFATIAVQCTLLLCGILLLILRPARH